MKTLCFFLMILFFTQGLYSQSRVLQQLNSNNDHGVAFEFDIKGPITGPWVFKYHQEQRIGARYHKIWYQEYVGAIFYDFTKKLKPFLDSGFKQFQIGPGYNITYQFERDTLGRWQHVYIQKPLIEAYYTHLLGKWKTVTRLRGEYQAYMKPHFHSHGIFRYRLVVYTPWKFTEAGVNPYLSNELFFRQQSYSRSRPTGLMGGYYQNRFRAGFNIQLIEESLNSDFYWQWRVDKRRPGQYPHWWNTYYYGMTLKYNY